ncbi:MAG TPA: hypothetical protein VMV22_01385 [Acidimicrobiales bacterium]|nr:hypothetical protein [Acidimicrobiales bacterium]
MGSPDTTLIARLVPEGPVDVRIVADTVDFYRLVADRVDPAGFGAASLALD